MLLGAAAGRAQPPQPPLNQPPQREVNKTTKHGSGVMPREIRWVGLLIGFCYGANFMLMLEDYCLYLIEA